MTNEVIGRDDEIARLRTFLEGGADEGPRVLVLEGEAGIGKTTLFEAGLGIARERGLRILESRPTAAEEELAYTGLGDLLEAVLDVALPALPLPRRRALEIALLLADDDAHPLPPRAVPVAVRSALEELAAEQPLVLAVDDVQWLDRPSADALAYALRRTSARVHLLLARRPETRGTTNLDRALPAIEHLRVGPLSVGALQAVIRERLDRAFPRPMLLRIHDTSAGNPFYALELARTLPEDLDLIDPLPVPATLEELVRARIESLPESSRQVLLLLAALGEADEDTFRGIDDLEAAVSRGIVERAAGRLRFAHPLLGSAVYRSADEGERRKAHATVAELVREPLTRARHLALAARGADPEVAAALDEAASIASSRGLPDVAAELAERARRLTPQHDPNGRHRRAIVAATAQLRGGDVGRARSLAEATLAEAAGERARGEALVLMSAVEIAAGDVDRAIALRREALSVATDPALQAAVHQWLAVWSGDLGEKERHARAAVDLTERLDDGYLRAGALAVLALRRFEAGEPGAVELAEQAHDLAARVRRVDGARSPAELAHILAWTRDGSLVASFVFGNMLIILGRLGRARALLDELERELAQRDEQCLGTVFGFGSWLELEAGRWDRADALARRQRDVEALYQSPEWAGPYVLQAQLALHRGDLDEARSFAVRGRELAVTDPGWLPTDVEAQVGLVDRARGAPAAAIEAFTAAEAVIQARGVREPSLHWWRAELAEALLEVGRVDDAVRLLDAWETEAGRLGRERVLARVTRCRGLVAAAHGDVDSALSLLERAVGETDADTDRLEHARALLALGAMRRRARQKRGAREAIGAALAIFEELGDVPWTERARAELGRIGGRTREDGLTPAERRVAALVAEGRTNREVAAALVLGERTVETHLSHIYAKLGVRSRTELARVYVPAS